MRARFEHLMKPTVQPEVFTCTSDGSLRAEVVGIDPSRMEFRLGSLENGTVSITKESAETLSEFFGDVANQLETEQEHF